MNLSKSKYCEGLQCDKMLWLDINKPEEKEEASNQSSIEKGNKIGELARELFGEHISIDPSSNKIDMLKATLEAIKNKNAVITEASFAVDGNFCSVDILVKKGTEFEIYEVKSTSDIKDYHLDDISFQYHFLSDVGLNITKCNLVHLNNSYVRNGDLDLNGYFTIEDVNDTVKSKQEEVGANIKNINACLNDDEPSTKIGEHCSKPHECQFFSYCTRNLEKPNVFDLFKMPFKDKIKLFNSGFVTFEQLLNADIKDYYKTQIMHELYDLEPEIDIESIDKELFSKLSYPLYFLDFETIQQTIPEFDGVKVNQQVPFQYSLHYIEEEGGDLKHTEFLGDGVTDPRRELALRLVSEIPEDACCLAYNMSFEKTVIKSLAKLYPDLSDKLMKIHDNMKDLMIPFSKRHYYCKDMKGSYSIKYVLPALFPDDPELNYHNLDMVHNGSEAMDSYRMLSSLNDCDKANLRENMLKYCCLDTYAMVKIWKLLDEKVKEHRLNNSSCK